MEMLALCLFCFVSSSFAYTDIPIIGILSQESFAVQHLFPNDTYHSYIAASYVKLVESAGGRAIPIWIGQSVDYYRKVVDNTNGILFPGGATYFNNSHGYAEAGQILYDIALQKNRKGDYYPIFGICLGMELMAEIAVGLKKREVREKCLSKKISLPLVFKNDFAESKLFQQAPRQIIKILKTENVTYNYHQFCVTERNFTKVGLDKEWKVLSTNTDVYGLEFISSFESKRYPFYAVQFHPEKNPFEFKLSLHFPHSKEGVEVSQYFANFFIEETRRNNHAFASWEVEQKSLIYNYMPHFTGIKNGSYEQIYMFKKSDYKSFF